MHKLLERQLRRHFGSLDAVPAGMQPFLDAVDASYRESEADRLLVERSLELTSQELLQRNASLRERERERQIIFDSVPAMIFYKDRHNRILDLNAPAAAVMGRPVEQLRGVAAEEILPPDVARALHEDDLQVIRSAQPKLGIVESHPDAEGRVHWVRTDKVPYRDEKGNVKGVIVLSVDITERKLAEEAVKASEERYRLIVETATEGIWTIDQQARTTWCNRVLAGMLGLQPAEMVGHSVFEYMEASEVELAKRQLSTLMSGGRVALDFKFRRRDGSVLWTQVSAAPMRAADGTVAGALGMLTDVTERKQAEEKLREAYVRLQRVDKDRMQFLNTAAHELGTPLTPIRLQVHMLRGHAADLREEHRKAVAILERNFERLSRLVRDLLDSARLQASTLKLHSRPIDMAEVVYQAVENYLAPARETGVLLDVDELPAMPVVADPSRLGQVFDNLLSNAVKFSPAGSHVAVAARVDAGWAEVEVRDHGIGLRAEDLGRLFQPFTQVHDTEERPRGGTGLGLYVCRGILEAHGGHVAAASPGLGRGATFTVRMPLAAGPAAGAATRAEGPTLS